MTQEQFERANEISQEIQKLKEHRVEVTELKGKPIDYAKVSKKLVWDPGDGYVARVLWPEFLFVKFESFMGLYVSALNARIAELEAEFQSI